MRIFFSIVTISVILLVAGFNYNKSKFSQNIKENLVGSWELVSYIDHQNNGTSWESYDNSILYQKHITESHFTWIKYDKKANQLMGMGGGSFIVDDKGRYIEHLDFFYPPGSSELGQSIPFSVDFKESKWYHKGKAKKMELGDDGSMIVVGYNQIEEIWSPIVPTFQNDYKLVGSWDLKSYRYDINDEYLEYPVFTGYMKLITPTHFIWIKYDTEGDQVFQTGSGPYVFDGNKYVEVIEMIYPKQVSLINTQVLFNPKFNGNTWIHFGFVPQMEDGQNDSLLIDEIWIPKPFDEDDFSSTF